VTRLRNMPSSQVSIVLMGVVIFNTVRLRRPWP
jgi:hypothetical protein